MILACVRTGHKFGPEYVERLVHGVKRNSSVPCKFFCLTDLPETYAGVENHYVSGLPGWWAKMELFSPDWRRGHAVVYLDLDTVVNGNIDPLLKLDVPFGICRNFTRARSPNWPCNYGSCVMTLRSGYGRFIYDEFMASRHLLMRQNDLYGDQRVIEYLDEDAQYLQDLLPRGFFSHYRMGFRRDAALLIFGGQHKPHNHPEPWVTERWVA